MQKSKRKILFLDILTGDPILRSQIERHALGGYYMGNIQRMLGLGRGDFDVCDASRGKFPAPKNYRAMVISGSAGDSIRGKDGRWMRRTYAFIKRAVDAGIPILGICGGMQFAARALGGNVVLNGKGRHFGSIRILLTADGAKDPLFAGLPRSFFAQCNHKCIVPKAKRGWKVLAASAKAPVEALAIGDRIRLVQFHPEKSASDMRQIAAESGKGISYIFRNTTRDGKQIFRNFLKCITDTKKGDHVARLVRGPACF